MTNATSVSRGQVWASLGFSTSYSGTFAEDSIASDAHYVIDWIPKPGIDDPSVDDDSDWLVIAADQDGDVIWEGPQDERVASIGEAESAYQADLRKTWLSPSAGVAFAGLLLGVFGRRRTATDNSP